MSIDGRFGWLCLLASLTALPAQAEKPMSAIDWLSRSVATAPPGGTGAALTLPPRSAAPVQQSIAVSVLGTTTLDSLGLLPVSVSGLPRGLWSQSATADLIQLLKDEPADMPPALQELFYTLLLTEADAPRDAGASGRFLLARVDKLLDLGALDQAQALLQLSGTSRPAFFRRWFDVELLLGQEDTACAQMRRQPEISPTVPARIYCLARQNDWGAAQITLTGANALGLLDPDDQRVLARFLDSGSDDTAAPLAPPARPSPLIWRMMEAIGEPLPTATLPLAFAQADLRSNTGWKTQIAAAERLARSGAVSPNKLIGVYLEGRPSASGDPWDRVGAVQALDTALRAKNRAGVIKALAPAWQAMQAAGLSVPFATLYGRSLQLMHLPGDAGTTAYRIGLLAPSFELAAINHTATGPEDAFLNAVARGKLTAATTVPDTPVAAAIASAFTSPAPDDDLAKLLQADRIGEAVLIAIERIAEGSNGDLSKVTQGLQLLRRAGLETVARRTALQLLLLPEQS